MNLEKGQITRFSELMEPEAFDIRMLEKMNFVDEVYKEAVKELTDEVDMFAKEVTERYSIRHLKFAEELKEFQ